MSLPLTLHERVVAQGASSCDAALLTTRSFWCCPSEHCRCPFVKQPGRPKAQPCSQHASSMGRTWVRLMANNWTIRVKSEPPVPPSKYESSANKSLK
eukprot:5241745-Amphidinium_carterae.1